MYLGKLEALCLFSVASFPIPPHIRHLQVHQVMSSRGLYGDLSPHPFACVLLGTVLVHTGDASSVPLFFK